MKKTIFCRHCMNFRTRKNFSLILWGTQHLDVCVWGEETTFRRVCVCVCVCVKSFQSCLTLCNSTDCSPPGSVVYGILQAEYWSGLPCPPPGDLPNSGIEPHLLQLLPCRRILYHWATGEAHRQMNKTQNDFNHVNYLNGQNFNIIYSHSFFISMPQRICWKNTKCPIKKSAESDDYS